MASRPNFIDLGNGRPGSPPQSDFLPSPRSGEIPPALSPLDAFALQGRLLAQQLEASQNNGRRISRLPPLTIANELAKPRPGYFTAPPSAGPRRDYASSSPLSATAELPRASPEVARPAERPVSRYPFIQTFDDAESLFTRDSASTIKQVHDPDEVEPSRSPIAYSNVTHGPFYTAPSAQSNHGVFPAVKEENIDDDQPSHPPVHPPPQAPPNAHASLSERHRPAPLAGLAVPVSPHSVRSPSFQRNELGTRYPRSDNGDDSDSLSIPGDRKLSSSSAFARPRSPYSPLFAPPRSPSVSSERSAQLRASVNFSRPMSRVGKPERRPSYEGSLRSETWDTPPTRPSVDATSLNESASDSPRLPMLPWVEGNTTPLSFTDDDTSSTSSLPNGAPSYIYAKYSLPRGRILSRNSVLMQDFSTHKFEWEQPRVRESNVTPVKTAGAAVSEAGSGGAQEPSARVSHLVMSTVPDVQPPNRSYSADDATPIGRSVQMHKPNASIPPKPPSTLTTHSEATLGEENVMPNSPDSPRATTSHGKTSFAHSRGTEAMQLTETVIQLTPEGHLAKGIELHEEGQLQKSTYHLRLAARGGNATAMLIYALACRHGWGMRANQTEGVNWLRRAVESAGLEVAEDEDPGQSGEGQATAAAEAPPDDALAKKTHKAQLALAIYELGVSYMNGWGIEQDKPLGLRCFEISGAWGDGDALSEAGFCYVKGLGCKKDLKKAAEFYRRAEKRGVEMAGNSWIYKDKYMPSKTVEEQRKGRGADKDKEKKPRDKSRTRTIFGGRKKQVQLEQEQGQPPPRPSTATA